MDYDREVIRDLLNNEANITYIANLYELAYCNICGNYDFAENFDENLDGTYKCQYCEHNVCEDDIVFSDMFVNYNNNCGFDNDL